MQTLAKYTNGNYDVAILEDGTKIREWDENPLPKFPESLDIKVTNWCDAKCPQCHENSTVRGEHAKLQHVKYVLSGFPKGIELAIGGGDPLSHPFSENILCYLTRKGFINNITIFAKHLERHYRAIVFYRKVNWIRGLGISYDKSFSEDIKKYADENSVIHLIVGVHSPKDAIDALKLHRKILILGYKIFGRGVKYDAKKLERSISEWRYWIGTICRTKNSIVSFDNLAIKQLDLKRILKPNAWEKFYMGDDGKFTMYIDTVKMEYAVSSTSQKLPLNGMTAIDAFKVMQRENRIEIL